MSNKRQTVRVYRAVSRRLCLLTVLLAATAVGWLPPPVWAQSNVFTTVCDASVVNMNLFSDPLDVYLSGGPTSCGTSNLPDGKYYFQVTDPSGVALLSTDPLNCHVFMVTNGLSTQYSPDPSCPAAPGPAACMGTSPGPHNSGISHCGLPRIDVQLAPFGQTPNGGGVYKMWAMPVGQLPAGCDPTQVDPGSCGGSTHGFVNGGGTKTDNFRIKGTPPSSGGNLEVFKFCDANANGFLDSNELTFGLNGWSFSSSPSGCSGTTSTINSQTGLLECKNIPANTYQETETVQSGFLLTATCINGECGHCSINTTMLCNATADCLTGQTCVPMPSNPASISVANGDMDELDFGNVGLSTVSGQKFDYLNPGTGINGFKIVLTGTQANGAAVSKCAITSTNGNYSFGNLLPGSYTVKEMPPAGTTIAKSPTSCAENLQVNGTTCAGQTQTCNFSNICLAQRNVRTIGYWANHGNSSITGAALCALNQLNLRNANGTLFTPITGCPTPSMAQITAGRAAVASFLLSATATNMANMLSAQLAAMELNVMLLSPNGAMLGDELFAGPSSCFTNPPLSALGEITLGDLINWVSTGVIADLGAHGTTTSGSAYRACQEYKKNALDSANNDLNFVGDCNFAQTCP